MKSLTWIAIGLCISGAAWANESIYPATPVGHYEVKDLPPAKTASAKAEGTYFDTYTTAFKTLWSFLKQNKLAMTVPVEADTDERSQMRLYFASKDLEKSLTANDKVIITNLPERTVASFGLRGEYREKPYQAGVQNLQQWLSTNTQWEVSGPPYVVYWDGPFKLGFIRRSEVHIPVKPVAKDQ